MKDYVFIIWIKHYHPSLPLYQLPQHICKTRIQLARASEETLSSEQDLSTNSPNILPCIVMVISHQKYFVNKTNYTCSTYFTIEHFFFSKITLYSETRCWKNGVDGSLDKFCRDYVFSELNYLTWFELLIWPVLRSIYRYKCQQCGGGSLNY